MRIKIRILIGLFLLCCQAHAQQQAAPGWAYFSLYGGWGATSSGTIDGMILESVDPWTVVYVDNPYDQSNTGIIGCRVGFWMDMYSFSQSNASVPESNWIPRGYWGLALDVSKYQVDSTSPYTHIGVVPVSIMCMYGYPLFSSSDFPHGRVQPYLGVGGALFMVDVETEVEFTNGTKANQQASLWDGGWGACAGFNYRVTKRISVFLEYRYLYSHIDLDNPKFASGDFAALDTELSSNQLLAGFSLTSQ